MAIIRTPKTKDYFAVSNNLAQDSRLSFEARGVLLYLLSKPNDWEIQFSDVENEGNLGREKRQKIFAELEKAGYFKRVEKRVKGRFDYDYLLLETPINIEAQPRTVKPLTVKTATAQPLTVKPPLTKDLKKQNTEKQIKEEERARVENSPRKETPFCLNESEPPAKLSPEVIRFPSLIGQKLSTEKLNEIVGLFCYIAEQQGRKTLQKDYEWFEMVKLLEMEGMTINGMKSLYRYCREKEKMTAITPKVMNWKLAAYKNFLEQLKTKREKPKSAEKPFDPMCIVLENSAISPSYL